MSEAATGLVLGETAPRGCLNIRGDADRPGFLAAVSAVAGVALPVQPCSWRAAGHTAAYWLGPDEWLVATQAGAEADLESGLRDRLEGSFSIVDTTGNQVWLNLSGPSLGQILQKSSPYDFHPRNFTPGRCVQTTFAKASALLAANADGSVDLAVRRSYADYLDRWIADAAEEYGFTDETSRGP